MSHEGRVGSHEGSGRRPRFKRGAGERVGPQAGPAAERSGTPKAERFPPVNTLIPGDPTTLDAANLLSGRGVVERYNGPSGQTIESRSQMSPVDEVVQGEIVDSQPVSPALGTQRAKLIVVHHPLDGIPQSRLGRAEITLRTTIGSALAGPARRIVELDNRIKDVNTQDSLPDHPFVHTRRSNAIATANERDAQPHMKPSTKARLGIPLALGGLLPEVAFNPVETAILGGFEMAAAAGIAYRYPRFAYNHPKLLSSVGASGVISEAVQFVPHDDPRVLAGGFLFSGAALLTAAAFDKRRERKIRGLSTDALDNAARTMDHRLLMGDPAHNHPGKLHEDRAQAVLRFELARQTYWDTRSHYDENGYRGLGRRARKAMYRGILRSHSNYVQAGEAYMGLTREIELRSRHSR